MLTLAQRLQAEIDRANSTTDKSDTTVHDAVGSLIDGYGKGGGSVPKPLTYDYMPEGYPKKSVQTTTLMYEHEVAFALDEGLYLAYPTEAFEIVEGQTYAVNWDGTEYECVGLAFDENMSVIGNLSILGTGDDSREPFVYSYFKPGASGQFATLDTSATHTISVKKTEEIITPMAEEFLPSEVNELIMNSSTPDSTKKFKITVDDRGTISATEVT